MRAKPRHVSQSDIKVVQYIQEVTLVPSSHSSLAPQLCQGPRIKEASQCHSEANQDAP